MSVPLYYLWAELGLGLGWGCFVSHVRHTCTVTHCDIVTLAKVEGLSHIYINYHCEACSHLRVWGLLTLELSQLGFLTRVITVRLTHIYILIMRLTHTWVITLRLIQSLHYHCEAHSHLYSYYGSLTFTLRVWGSLTFTWQVWGSLTFTWQVWGSLHLHSNTLWHGYAS